VAHYKIQEKLGEGGMGVVYKAQDTKLDRLVALKFLPQSLAADTVERERFIHEAKAASALNHPNITTIYEIGEFEGQLYISMELVEGKTLKQVAEQNNLNLDRILDMGIQICEALGAAHEKGIIHRDIKSDNIALTSKGLVKIMDFGLAKLKGATKLTRTGSTVGTAAYMSPEQAQGMEVDHRTDIFSFGVVFYELIAGKLPFGGEHQAAIIYSICNEEPEPLSRFRSGVPENLQRVIDKALAKNAEERFQHIVDLSADLRRIKRESSSGAKEAPRSDKKSVAVLYFENLSSDPESDYFAAGMTEDIITDLSKIEGIRVASRNAVLPYKGKPVDIQVLGKKMNLDAVLEGSIRKAGNRLRITAQLIDTKEGFHLWAERYDREVQEIFDLQEEIAKNIASALKIKLSPKEEEKIAQKYKGDLRAYEYYLKGRSYYYKYTKSDMLAAVQMFKKALEIDPNYALAHAGLADSYYQFIDKGFETDKSFLVRAEEAAQKSLSIDSECAEAYKALGTIYFRLGKLNSAKRLLSRALEINPNYHPARANLSLVNRELGDFEQAEKELLFVYERDPSFPFTSFLLALHYLSTNEYAQTEKYAGRVLELGESTFYLAMGNYLLGMVYLYQNEPQKALEYMKKSEGFESNPSTILGVAMAHTVLGNEDQARRLVEEVLKKYPTHEWTLMSLIFCYALLGEKEKVYEWLRKGADEDNLEWIALDKSPLLKEFRDEPEFQRILQEHKNRQRNSE